jgi:enoyl-[acyl-carrier protein] reductase II
LESRDLLATRACRLLEIAVPVVGAPMGGVAGPELAAAVSSAGGLGLLGHANTDLAQVRAQIREVKRRTDRPFGVGLLFPADAAPAEPAAPAPEQQLPEFLERFRSESGSGFAPAPAEPARRFSAADAQRRLDIVIEEGVPVLACGLGTPAAVVARAKATGIRVMSLVGSARAAAEVEQRGVDLVVAQGHEAGGHTGRTTTFVLVPQVVDAVRVPVLAAGGVMDGRGLAAALMLGASGVLLGTRLLATPEAHTADSHKQRVVEMREDETVVSRCYTGKPSRVVRNAFTDAWRGHETEIRPMPQQWDLVKQVVAPAKAAGSLEVGNWPTGQGAVLVGSIVPAAELVRQVVAEAAALLAGGPRTAGAPTREGAGWPGS